LANVRYEFRWNNWNIEHISQHRTRRADEYAKRHGRKRADLGAAGLSGMIESAA
jgi:hypothetical protein